MTIVRVKGVKRYRSKGRWYAYHRASGRRLKGEFGSPAFFAELSAIDQNSRAREPLPGTIGQLLARYRSSSAYQDLAETSKHGYARMMNLLEPIDAMPLVELTAQFVAQLRDKLGVKHGRRQANYVLAVLSVACEHGREVGIMSENPVRGVKRLRRLRKAGTANRPWSQHERQVVLQKSPPQLRVPIALAMFTGLRKGDVLTLTRSALRGQRLWRRTGKTGSEVSLPLHHDLIEILGRAPFHDAITVAATSRGTPWTVEGFNSTFIKFIRSLELAGDVEPGLTFHGLRHTCGTLLVEAGFDIDSVRRWLGQKTLAMAIHYTESADTSERLRTLLSHFDPLGTKN